MCEYKIRISARPQKKGVQTLTETEKDSEQPKNSEEHKKEKGHTGCKRSLTGVCCGQHHKGQQK